MKRDVGKRVFLALLLVIFALLLWMCIDGRQIIRWTADAAYSRQNDSLYIKKLEDGAVFIGGEGKLYGTDMQALIEGESLTAGDVKDIIIGDGITEVGYDAICKYPVLHTVRLGNDVTVAGNGSIRECPEMWFVYVPSGIKKISRDFLYECNDCTVITDGPADDLPKLKNTSKSNIIGDVGSYEAMQAAWNNGTELPEIMQGWWP